MDTSLSSSMGFCMRARCLFVCLMHPTGGILWRGKDWTARPSDSDSLYLCYNLLSQSGSICTMLRYRWINWSSLAFPPVHQPIRIITPHLVCSKYLSQLAEQLPARAEDKWANGPTILRRQICLVLNQIFPLCHHLISWHALVLNSSKMFPLISSWVDRKVGIIGAFH